MFNVYYANLSDTYVLRFLPDTFYGGNHGVPLKGRYTTKSTAKQVCSILEYICLQQKELFFFVEDNNIHFGNLNIKIFTVAYANEFHTVYDLMNSWSELTQWYECKGYLDED